MKRIFLLTAFLLGTALPAEAAMTPSQCRGTGLAWSGGKCLCEIGYYSSDGTGDAGCQPCPSGKYADSRGSSSCKTCSSGCSRTGNACNGGSYWNSSLRCACEVGYYSSTGTGNSCKPCPAGTYAANRNTSSCTPCAVGYYSYEGARYCYPCSDLGKWGDKTGQSSDGCRSCTEIPVENGTCKQAFCTTTGTCTAATCDKGYKANGGKCEKIVCSAGQYISGTSCADCPAGSYCDGTDKHSCASGTWSSAKASSCTACSAISIDHGSCHGCSSTGTCTSVWCDDGYQSSGNKCVKVSCSAGQYICGNYCCSCSAGTYSSSSGSTSCTNCPYGKWSYSGASSCVSCSAISVANGTCTSCTSTGSCTAVSCNSGYTANGTTCEKITCPANCKTCSDSSTCTACNSYYALENGICVDICRNYVKFEGGTCEKYCIQDYGKECLSAVCTSGSPHRKEVISAKGYSYSHYYCCPTNCAECTDWEQCTACNSGYTLKNGLCVQTPTCAAGEYANSSGNCVSCSTITVKASNGYPGSGKCTACMEGGICTNAECYKGFENDPDNPGQCNFISGCEGLTAGAVYYDEASNSCKSCSTISGNAVNGGCMFCSNKNGTPTCDQWACYSGYSVRFTPPAGYDIVCGKSTCMYTSYFNINTGECAACPSGTIGNCSTPSTACIACSDAIKIENGKCVNCEAKSGNGYAPRPTCTEVECDEGYTYDEEEKECLPGATCKYPLKAVADYSGDCVGCCTD